MAMTPIEVEVLRNAMSSIADEAYISLMKSAYSTNIKERRDHSTAIFDSHGRVIVQGESMPLHLASMLGLVEVILEKYDPGDIAPGDLFISNDPFVGRGSHLPDVATVMPVFAGRELVLFVSNIAHHADIGGMAPGSMAGGMTEIYQEGLRIPPIRLFRGGELDRDIMDLILLNVRVPEERRGDYNAQIAANRLAVRGCERLIEKWTVPAIRAGCRRIIESVEKRIRASVAALPDGCGASRTCSTTTAWGPRRSRSGCRSRSRETGSGSTSREPRRRYGATSTSPWPGSRRAASTR